MDTIPHERGQRGMRELGKLNWRFGNEISSTINSNGTNFISQNTNLVRIDIVNMHFGAGQSRLDLVVSNQRIFVVSSKLARSILD